MSHFERKVEVPFDGPDGYTVTGKAEFKADFYNDEMELNQDSLIVRVNGKVVEMDETVENDIVNQIYGMASDILREHIRDMYEYRAETAHYR